MRTRRVGRTVGLALMMALIRHEARLGPGVDLSQGAPWGLVQSWVRTAVNSKALAPHRCPPLRPELYPAWQLFFRLARERVLNSLIMIEII